MVPGLLPSICMYQLSSTHLQVPVSGNGTGFGPIIGSMIITLTSTFACRKSSWNSMLDNSKPRIGFLLDA